MFTLGNKEAIVNADAKYKVTLSTPAGTTQLMTIEGFGSFEQSHIVEAFVQRFVGARTAALTITAPAPADLGITAGEVNVPVVAHIRVNTTRHSSEWATDFIKRGRPFIFELLINGSDTAADIATKLEVAMTEYELKFNFSDRGLPFTHSVTSTDVVLELKDPYLTFQSSVDFLPKGSTYGIKAVTTSLVDSGNTVSAVLGNDLTVDATTGILVGDVVGVGAVTSTVTDIPNATTITVADGTGIVAGALLVEKSAQEPLFDGKYLEENVRMSLPNTSDSYGISPDEKPVISGGYTTITWKAKDTVTGGVNELCKRHKGLGGTRGEEAGDRTAMFTLYILEGAGMHAASGKVDTVLSFLEGALGVIAPSNTSLIARLSNLTLAANKAAVLA